MQGVVDHVVRPGRVKGRAQIDLHFTTMIFPNGSIVEVPGVLNSLPGSDGPKVKDSEGTVEQAGNKGRDVGNIAKGAAIGAEAGVLGGAASGDVLKEKKMGGAQRSLSSNLTGKSRVGKRKHSKNSSSSHVRWCERGAPRRCCYSGQIVL